MGVNFWNALIFSEVPFCLVPKAFDLIDMVMLMSKKLRMVNTIMLKFKHIEDIIRSVTVRINDAVWLDFLTNNRHKRGRFCIVNDLSVDLRPTFYDTEDRNLSSSTPSSFSLAHTAKITFIELNSPTKLLASILLFESNLLSQFVEKSNG